MVREKKRFFHSPILKQIWVVSGAALNVVGHGCMHGYPAALIKNAAPELQLSAETISWIVSSSGITLVAGTLLAGVLVNKWGRKRAHQLCTLPAMAGWILLAVADSMLALLVGRLLHGLALGMRAPVAAVIIGEYTSPLYRGAFLSTIALSLATGMLFSHSIGAILSWRYTALVCGIYQVVAFLIITMSPESPSWLASKGKHVDAIAAFHWLRGTKEERELDILIKSQKVEIENNMNVYQESCFKRFRSAISKKELYKALIISYCLFVCFEFSGMHIVPAYAYILFKAILVDDTYIDWYVNMVDVLRVFATVCAFFFVYLFKRRAMLFVSASLTIVFYIALSAFMFLRDFGYLEVNINFPPLLLFTCYMLSLSCGVVPLTWTLNGEIFPLAHKTVGSTAGCVFFAINYFLSLKTAPIIFSLVGVRGAFLVYPTIVSIAMTVLWKILPETKGKLLQEIECELKGETLKSMENNDNSQADTVLLGDEFKRKLSAVSVQIDL